MEGYWLYNASANNIPVLHGPSSINQLEHHRPSSRNPSIFPVEEYVPNVIEPSFGLGRLFHCSMEHNFAVREVDANRTYFKFPIAIAPFSFAILPLSSKPQLMAIVETIDEMLTDAGIEAMIDSSSSSIGKRYTRCDIVGVPYAITVDFESVSGGDSGGTVTMRERDSMQQIRLKVDELDNVLRHLVAGRSTWSDLTERYPTFETQQI